MAKNSSRIQETSELSCMWGLFTRQARHSPKMISNGRPVIKHIIDNSRKIDQLASFDDECRKIQKQADLAVDSSERRVMNLTQEDYSYIEKQKNKQIVVKEKRTHKTAARKKRQKTCESSLSQSNHLTILTTSRNHLEEPRFPEDSSRSIHLGKHESKPFSNALEVLNINKDLSMELFQENGRYSRNVSLSKKLMHRFRGTRKESNQLWVDGNRSFLGDRCMCRGVETGIPLNSPTIVKTKVNVLVKKVDLKSDKGADIACVSDTVRKKIDFSSARLSERQPVDVVLEASRSPLRIEKEVTSCDDDEFEEYDEIIEILSAETNETIISARTETIENSISDSLSEEYDYPTTPTSIYQSDMSENINKYQEEHRSPVSVLEKIFTEDANSPSSITNQTQTARHSLQPRRLNFQECLSKSSSSIDEQDYISHYVHSVLEASCLNWDQLERIRPLSEELLLTSLFDEVEFLSSGPYVDHKLLFDHINEVLLKIHRSRFCYPPWLAFVKRKMISSLPLEEVVLDEIMKEAEFYLLPWTEKRTLDQLVAKDLADTRLWVDVRFETEHVVIHIAEDILVESILDVILEFYL